MLSSLSPLRPLLALFPTRPSEDRAISVGLPRDLSEAADALCAALHHADPQGGWARVRVHVAPHPAWGSQSQFVVESRGDELLATAYLGSVTRRPYALAAGDGPALVAVEADEIDVWDGDHAPPTPRKRGPARLTGPRGLSWEDMAADHAAYVMLDPDGTGGWLCLAWSDLL